MTPRALSLLLAAVLGVQLSGTGVRAAREIDDEPAAHAHNTPTAQPVSLGRLPLGDEPVDSLKETGKTVGNKALSCTLTMGVLCCTTAAMGVASILCASSALLCIGGIMSLIQALWVPAVVLFGTAVGTCGLSGVFGLIAAGFMGLGGWLRSIGLWSWEAQLVFDVFMTVFSTAMSVL